MKVLGFAFDGCKENEYLPHNYPTNSVCYTGTHDNMTTLQWFDTASYEALDFVVEYMGLEDVADKMTQKELVWSLIKTAMASVSDLCIVQMQDLLDLGPEARMNLPGTLSDANWTWRGEEKHFTQKLAQRLKHLTRLYDRLA
jgi:4-alpha-glucanotransferase